MASAKRGRRRRTARSTNGKPVRVHLTYRDRDNPVAVAVKRIGGVTATAKVLGRSRQHVQNLLKAGTVKSAQDASLLAQYGLVGYADLAGFALPKA
jgi:hypothetical protein